MGSRGSIIPFFNSIKDSNNFPVTDKRMTRFMITLEQGVDLIWQTFQDMAGGEIFVKKIPSMNIMDIIKAFSENANIKYIGIRPGEKLHEQMISSEDAKFTYEYDNYFKIFSPFQSTKEFKIENGKKVDDEFVYTSDKNKDVMSIEKIKKWIIDNNSVFQK